MTIGRILHGYVKVHIKTSSKQKTSMLTSIGEYHLEVTKASDNFPSVQRSKMDNISAGASATRMAHLSQVLLCLYGLRFSYSAITKLQKYEKSTQTLATYSKDVQTHLSLTRSTQATGLVTVRQD